MGQAEVFFDELPTILKEVPLQPGEDAHAWFAIAPRRGRQDPKVKAVMTQGAVAADNAFS